MFKLQKKEDSKYFFKVSENLNDFDKYVEEAYQATKHKFAVEGFRKGKVPRKVIEQNYGAQIFFEDAFEAMLQAEYRNILTKHEEIIPVVAPNVQDFKMDDKKVSAVLVIIAEPEVELGKYSGLEIEEIKEEVSEEAIQNEINQIQNRQARFVPVEREAKLGDFVVIDFIGRVDGKEFEGGRATDYRLELGSHTFIDTFEDQLVGLHIGEKKIVKVTFPEQYTEALKGKKAEFEVTLNKVEEKELPKLDDEFASNVSEFNTFEEFKADIKKHLQESLENKLKQENENKLIQTIVEKATVKIPAEMIEMQTESRIKDFESRLAYQGLKLEEYFNYTGQTMEMLKEAQNKVSEESIKTSLVLQAIIKKENITVSDEELDKKLEEIATKYKKSLKDYKKSMVQEDISYFKSDILMSKLFDLLKSKNKMI